MREHHIAGRRIRTLIVDDEPAIAEDVKQLLARHELFTEVGTCGSVSDAVVLIKKLAPDLVLLDVELSDGTCFELLEQVETINFQIIFITAFNDYAIKALKTGALDYLLKPIDRNEFYEAIAKVAAMPAQQAGYKELLQMAQYHAEPSFRKSRIALRAKNYVELVNYEEILYCHSDGCYTTFYLTDNRKIVVSKPIKEYDELLDHMIFIRTHQSYIVNINHVSRYHKDGFLLLRTGTEIPVSTRKRDLVLNFIAGI